jgi:hypothetical protein
MIGREIATPTMAPFKWFSYVVGVACHLRGSFTGEVKDSDEFQILWQQIGQIIPVRRQIGIETPFPKIGG